MTFVVDDDGVVYERDLRAGDRPRRTYAEDTSDVGLARRRMTIAALPTPCSILMRPIAPWSVRRRCPRERSASR